MKIISFGWTAAALVARAKTVTRRTWKAHWAANFKKGDYCKAYNKDPRYGGSHIALIKLTEDVRLEPLIKMPDSDYEAEGFVFLAANPWLVPKSMPYGVSLEAFEAWRQSGGEMYVVRFEVEELTAAGLCMFRSIVDAQRGRPGLLEDEVPF